MVLFNQSLEEIVSFQKHDYYLICFKNVVSCIFWKKDACE